MNLVFIYLKELEFEKQNRFTLNFTNNDENEETNYVNPITT